MKKPESNSEFITQLIKDEKILWRERPNLRQWLNHNWGMLKFTLIICPLVLCGVLFLFWAEFVSLKTLFSSLSSLIYLPINTVSIICLCVGVWRVLIAPLYTDFRELSRTTYLITDKQILVIVGKEKQTAQISSYSELKAEDLIVSQRRSANFLFFTTEQYYNEEGYPDTRKVCFKYISNLEQVEKLITENFIQKTEAVPA